MVLTVQNPKSSRIGNIIVRILVLTQIRLLTRIEVELSSIYRGENICR